MERKIDHLGRIVIPKEIGRRLNINVGDEIFFCESDGAIYATKDNVTDFISRNLDSIGRIVFPAELRRKLSIANGTCLDVQIEMDMIKFTKSSIRCAMCSSVDNVKDVKGIRICESCLNEIKEGTYFNV